MNREPARSLEAMESRREGDTSSVCRKNIQWTLGLENLVCDCAAEAVPGKKGYWRRLEDLWNSQQPTLPSTGKLLAARRNLILKRRLENDEDTSNPTPGDGAGQGEREPETGAAQVESEENERSEREREREERMKLKLNLEGRWQRLAAAAPSSLARKRHNKVLGSDKDLLGRVETLMMEIWSERECDDPWELVCLMYAGIEVISDAVKQPKADQVGAKSSYLRIQALTLLNFAFALELKPGC